jgi:hypothetical protein
VRRYFINIESDKKFIGQKIEKTKKEIGHGNFGTAFTFDSEDNTTNSKLVKKFINSKETSNYCVDTMKKLYNQVHQLGISNTIIFPIPQKENDNDELVLLMPYIGGRILLNILDDKNEKITNTVEIFNTYLFTVRQCHDNEIFLEDHKADDLILGEDGILRKIDNDWEALKEKNTLRGSPLYTIPVYTKAFESLKNILSKNTPGNVAKIKTLQSLYDVLMVATLCILKEKKGQYMVHNFSDSLKRKEKNKKSSVDELYKIRETVLTCIKPEYKDSIKSLINLFHENAQGVDEDNISKVYDEIQKIPGYQLLEYTG